MCVFCSTHFAAANFLAKSLVHLVFTFAVDLRSWALAEAKSSYSGRDYSVVQCRAAVQCASVWFSCVMPCCAAVWCSVVQLCGSVLCSCMVQCCAAVWCSAVQLYGAVLCSCMMQCCAAVWCNVVCCAARLLAHLKANGTRRVPTLVFCNSARTACYLGYVLEAQGINHTLLHSRMPHSVSTLSH